MKNSGFALRTTTTCTASSPASSPATAKSDPISAPSSRFTGGWSIVTVATPASRVRVRPGYSLIRGFCRDVHPPGGVV